VSDAFAESQFGIILKWAALRRGIEYAAPKWEVESDIADGILHSVRIDPNLVELAFGSAKEEVRKPKTAAAWCKEKVFDVAINAGMFREDHLTNVGYLKNDGILNNAKFNDYQSVLAFGPAKKGLPLSVIFDRDGMNGLGNVEDYRFIVQNLRLIKSPGKSVWQKQQKSWSEAAIASDSEGRILFLFSRTPFTMWEFNEKLLKLGLGIQQAMHVEGGPEASLSIHAGGVDVDLSGSYETGFNENDDNERQWPLPNVIGVLPLRFEP